ncbi:uncharacterized protein [Magallana gigas]|uniref:uncharacterized protein n=1 Tax=Magallana gigas TaxID=29159 RepID=UPI00333F7454
MSNACAKSFWLSFMVLTIFKLETTAFVKKRAYQTSTNGSYEAFLGCDGDMDTFSLTAEENSQWLMKIDKSIRIIWIYVSIRAGTYRITVKDTESEYVSCANISKPKDNAQIMKKIITCSNSEFKYGHKVLITSLEKNPMQIYEVEIIGVSQINQTTIWNVSDSVDTKSKALDNNLDTFYSSEERTNASWILILDATYLMKWFLISIRGGTFEVHITTGDAELNLTTLCKRFSLPGIIQNHTALECDKEMRGDTIVLKKMDEDSLRLFEFIPISKFTLTF